MNDERTAYEILGVEPSASLTDIKIAYRNLRGRHHPDRNPDCPASSFAFQKVQKAYEAIGTEEARANYDQYGFEDPNTPSVERDAERLAADLVSQALDRNDCEPCDIAFKLTDTFERMMDHANEAGGNFRVELANLDQFRSMVEPNRVIMAGFDHRRAKLVNDLAQAEHGVQVIERAQQMVDEFRFKEA